MEPEYFHAHAMDLVKWIGRKVVAVKYAEQFEDKLRALVGPLEHRTVLTIVDVGKAGAFLCSDMASGVTGEILYVDGGFSTVGMSFPGESAS